MIGVNNTGNVCIWPSEEALTNYVLSHRKMFKGKRVCEVGGGMASLAGLAVAISCQPQCVMLTDGNETSVSCIDASISANSELFNFPEGMISSHLLDWTNKAHYSSLENSFDIILCADCCFFDEVRSDLVQVLNALLSDNGIVVVIAPERSGTRKDFLQKAQKSYFNVKEIDQYGDDVMRMLEQHQATNELFDVNIHFPLMAHLTKKKSL
eukprot:m.141402 g.141402  ORF g.141402 m.141402 type:complete len:210 (+) comp38995_c0_seq1:2-631(+)